MADVDQLALDLAALAARLKEAADGGLTRELSRRIGDAVEPIEKQVRAGLKPRLPDRYAAVLEEDLQFSRRSFTNPDGTRVTVYAGTRGPAKRKLRRLDAGILWHPVFGNRKHWAEQAAGPGWFSGPAEDAISRAREGIRQAVDEVSAKAMGQGVP